MRLPATAAQAPAIGLARRLLQGTFNYGLGKVLPQIVGFLLIPLYTAFLTPEDYGLVDLAAALGPVLAMVMRFGVPGAVARFYYDHQEGRDLRSYVTTIHRFITVNSVLVAVGALVVLWQFGDVIVPGLPFFPFVILATVGAFAAGNSELQRRLVQAREQSGYAARLNIVFGLTNALLAIVFVAGFRWGAVGLVAAATLTSALFFVQAQWYLRRDVTGVPDRRHLASSLKYAAGVLPSDLVGTGRALACRSVLAAYSSIGAVGLFGLGWRFVSPLTILASSFTEAYLPIYFSVRRRGGASGAEELASAGRAVWRLAVFGYLGVALLGPLFVELVTPARFHAAGSLIPVLGLVFLAQVLHHLLAPEIYYSKKTFLVPLLGLSAGVFSVVVTAVTARSFGAHGAAWGLVSGMCASSAMAGFLSARLCTIRHDWLGLSRIAAAGLMAGGIGVAGPAHGIWSEIALAIAALVSYPVLLHVLGDRSIVALARQLRARTVV